MPNPTQKTLLIRALKRRGYRPIVVRARKYEAFEESLGGRVFFVGRGGALRVSKTTNASESVSLERHPLRKTLLEEGARG